MRLSQCKSYDWKFRLISKEPKRQQINGVRRTAFMQPSFSGLFVIWAYFPKTTLPPVVTMPSSETFTSMTVPFVITPSCVYIGDCGFFLTPRICNWKVAFRSAMTLFEYLESHGRENKGR